MFKHRKRGHKVLIFTCLAALLFMMSSTILSLAFVHKAKAQDPVTYKYNDSGNQSILGSDSHLFKRQSSGFYTYFNDIGNDTITTDNGKDGGPTGVLKIAGIPDQHINIAAYKTPPKTVDGYFINHSRIDIGNTIFFDARIDDHLNYFEVNGANDCENQSVIQGFHHLGYDTANATDTVTFDKYAMQGATCVHTPGTVKLHNQTYIGGITNYEIYFLWTNEGEISTSDHGHSFIAQNPQPGGADSSYYGDGNTGGLSGTACPDSLTGPVGAQTMTWIATDNDSFHDGWPKEIGNPGTTNNGKGCAYSGGTSVAIGDVNNSTIPPSTGTGDCGDTGDCGGDLNATCEARINNPLSWIMCPVFNGIADMSDWLYSQFIVPFLKATPISTVDSQNNVSFKVWSNFRVYGNIILVIAILVMVFGQAIGGGVVDAYTIKKVMPRILIAAILINLSIYIMAFMTDITNIAGKGMQQLIWAPLKQAGATHFQLSGIATFGSVGIAALASFLGAAGIAGIFTALAFGKGAFVSKAMMFIMFAVVIPVLLAIAGVFATLIIRRGLLVFLVITSPIAFALYCLPNTEQYFRRWWNLYIRTLLVYPVVVLIFALADVLTVTILLANGATGVAGNANGIIVALTAFVIQFLPLAMVPYAFRLSGGVMGAVYNGVKTGRSRVNDLTKSRREQAQKDTQRQMLSGRGRAYTALGNRGDAAPEGSARRRAYRFLQNRVGGYNLHGALAAQAAEQIKEAEAQKDTGIDDEERAFTVDKAWALSHDATGGTHWRNNPDGSGRRQFRTLGGRWVDEKDVDAAHQRWDGNQPMVQWALAYEMQKATTQEERDYLKENVGRLQESQGLSDGEMAGIWTGAAFMKQNTDREYKHHYWDGARGLLATSGMGLMREVDERQGSWQMASQAADTWTTMSHEVDRARTVIANQAAHPGYADGEMDLEAAQEVMQRGARIARSMQGGYQDEHGTYHSSIGQGASGRTKEEMENFAAMFDLTPTATSDYDREYGVERSAVPGRRSGDQPGSRPGAAAAPPGAPGGPAPVPPPRPARRG